MFSPSFSFGLLQGKRPNVCRFNKKDMIYVLEYYMYHKN